MTRYRHFGVSTSQWLAFLIVYAVNLLAGTNVMHTCQHGGCPLLHLLLACDVASYSTQETVAFCSLHGNLRCAFRVERLWGGRFRYGVTRVTRRGGNCVPGVAGSAACTVSGGTAWR